MNIEDINISNSKEINALFLLDKNTISEIRFFKDLNKCFNVNEYLGNFNGVDQEFIRYLKNNNISLIILDNKYEKDFCEDVCMFLNRMQFAIINDSKHIILKNRNGIIDSFEYENSHQFVTRIKKNSINDDVGYNCFENNITSYINYYCSQKMLANINNKIIKIKFNDDLYTKQQITTLINVCKHIVKTEDMYMNKPMLFVNTGEIFNMNSKETNMDTRYKEISNKYNELHEKLSQIVVGQDSAIEKVVKGLYEAELNPPKIEDARPLACFFFFGPAGTGKTFLMDNLANLLGYDFKKFHMEQYAMKGDEIALIGSDRQFKDSRVGDLVKFIFEKRDVPHIVLFDEIEKASSEVLASMLSMIGNGVVHDMYRAEDIHLNNTILVFTSNAGKDLFDDTSINFSNIELPTLLDALKKEVRDDKTPKFSPEFCSRIMASNVITFNHLSVSALSDIIRTDYSKLIENVKKEHNIKLRIDPKISLLSIYHTGKSDARVTKKYALSLIKNEMFETGRQSDSIDLNNINVFNYSVDFSNVDKEIKSLFVQNKKVKIGVIGNKNVIELFDKDAKEYEVISIKNEDELNESLSKGIFAYFIDPFFGGIKNKALSITDYNTDGINYLYKINEANSDVPIYVIDLENLISNSDKFSLVHDGAKKILIVDKVEGFREDVLDLIEENYLENQANAISQKGWIVDFKTRQELSDDGKKIDVILCNFRKYMAYDSTTSSLMIKQSDIPEDRFDDVIDCKEAKEELKYYIEYLKDPVNFVVNGARAPKGVLLFGPPGTGKTMLARAMAGESGVNFISTTAADLKTDNSETGESKIRNLFSRARKYAPTIIFIDEIDAIGKKRSGTSTDSILTALLTEMDGFNKSTKRPVFVLAATNYGTSSMNNEIAELDQALLRRFDSSIYVGVPNKEGREKYISLFLKKKNITGIKKSTINALVSCTVGQSLSIIENILEYAFRNSIIKDKKIDDAVLLNALDQYQNGEIIEVDYEQAINTAIHEAGHAFVSYLCGRIPAYITIEARANYGGYVFQEENNKRSFTKDELLEQIKICLAGRVAQELLLGKDKALNTGASDDLKKASKIALDIITTFGMDDKLLIMGIGDVLTSPRSEELMNKADEILKEQYEITKQLIAKNKNKVKKLADTLLAHGHLIKDEISNILKTSKSK